LLDLLEMNESNKTNTASDDSINRLLEKKGEQQVAKLLASSNKSKEEFQDALVNIMKEGEKEFIKANKRKMTYSELRSIYG